MMNKHLHIWDAVWADEAKSNTPKQEPKNTQEKPNKKGK